MSVCKEATTDIPGFPNYFIDNEGSGFRTLCDLDGNTLAMFDAAETDAGIALYLRGWLAGLSAGKAIGERETKADIRRSLGIGEG